VLLPKVLSQLESQLDVLGLDRLIASCEEKQQSRPALRVVDPVARADVDLELRNTAGEVTVLTRVSGDQSLDPNEDPGSTRSVLERVDPLGVLFSLVYPNESSVAQRLRMSSCRYE
jgi:hypothetical protein